MNNIHGRSWKAYDKFSCGQMTGHLDTGIYIQQSNDLCGMSFPFARLLAGLWALEKVHSLSVTFTKFVGVSGQELSVVELDGTNRECLLFFETGCD